MTNTSRGYRKIADSELDKAQAVNDALEDIDADVGTLAAQVASVPAASARISGTFNTATQALTFTDGVLTGAVPL